MLPIIDLRMLFGEPHAIEGDYRDGIIVSLESDHGKFTAFVDRIVGTQQVVVKDLDLGGNDTDHFTGCAVMGDGTIAVAIDIDTIAPR